MFLVRFFIRWRDAMRAIYEEMDAKEREFSPLSAEYYRIMPRTTAVIYLAPIPPLARFLQRKLI